MVQQFKDLALRQSSSHFKVSSTSQLGHLEIPTGAAHYEHIPSGLHFNHIDTEKTAPSYLERLSHSLNSSSLQHIQGFLW